MAEGAATRALRAALRVLGPAERDQAAVELARRYARLLDAAAVPASYAAALTRLERVAVDKAEQNALTKIRAALSAHTVASDLGPKYLAVLAQLGLTPAARGVQAAAPAPAEKEKPPEVKGTRDELKRRREQRANARAADSG